MLKMLICILTLLVLCGVSSNLAESIDDIVHTTTYKPLHHDSGILDLPFFQELRNPCYICQETMKKHPRGIEIPNYYPVLKRLLEEEESSVQQILQNYRPCNDFDATNLSESVTLTGLKEMEEKEAFNKIYRSLVLHSAYSFVAHHQLHVTRQNCTHNTTGMNEIKDVAYRLKGFACIIFLKMNISGYENDDIIPQLEARASLSCGGVDISVCTMMKTVQTLLQELQSYVIEKMAPVLDSTTSTANLSSVSIETTSSYTTLSS